jgi:hypothetical protein
MEGEEGQQKESGSLLKKRTKKLFLLWVMGIQTAPARRGKLWMPAFAGMTRVR